MTADTIIPVPPCTAPATSNMHFDSEKLLGERWILYFYPKDKTPGCTQEGEDFRDHYRQFKALGIKVFGVSQNSLESHEAFKSAYRFPFELLSDADGTLCKAFGVIKEKNFYGRKSQGIERSTFLIDEAGKIRASWRRVKVKGHIEEVLTAAKNIFT